MTNEWSIFILWGSRSPRSVDYNNLYKEILTTAKTTDLRKSEIVEQAQS
jgi:hypothetical protein